MPKHQVNIKRVYEQPSPKDGLRVLVDRLWPRGLSKEKAAVDWWLKDIAPSPDLRKWFNHEPDKWHDFQQKYRTELAQNPDNVDLLKQKIKAGKVTLLYGSKEERYNDAVVLQSFLAT